MDNHYHLLIRTPLANLSRCMRHLNGVYVQHYNRSTKSDGPLFRGRYKAILVEEDGYVLSVSRYIHLNPVSAKICHKPNQYKWSSYIAYLNKENMPSWLHSSYILNQMMGDDPRKSYLQFVSQGVDQITQDFYDKKQKGSIMGSDDFITKHLNGLSEQYRCAVATDVNRTKILPTPDIIMHCTAMHFSITTKELMKSQWGKKNTARLITIYLLRSLAHIPHSEIASYFGNLKSTSIGSLLLRCKKLAQLDPVFIQHIDQISLLIKHTAC